VDGWRSAGSHAQPELGWALIQAHWGFGYATEAAAAIRDWDTSPDPSTCWSL
jgi:RimJ/RimL family protein N-acetyltransferase